MLQCNEELSREVTGIQPGDVIVYHGVVGGARGLSLVVGIWPPRYNNEAPGYRQILVIEHERLEQRAIDLNGEDNYWSRVSDRRTLAQPE